jgi:hypothetical protein
MTPLTTRQQQLITNNVLAACKDITKLNKTGYNFLYLASGFIAHYNLQGFIAHYSEHDLQSDIERYARQNQWNNFRTGERDADYYHLKRDCYNMILGALGARYINAEQFMRDHFQIIHIG